MLILRTLILGVVGGGLSWHLSYAHSAENSTTSAPVTTRAEYTPKAFQQAQEKTISGTVTDESDGSGLPGVNILVKGTPWASSEATLRGRKGGSDCNRWWTS